MCRLLQSAVMWTGVWLWACVFFPHDSQNTPTARVQAETRHNRTRHLRFHFVVMPLSLPNCFLFLDTPNEALRPIAPGLVYYFQYNLFTGTEVGKPDLTQDRYSAQREILLSPHKPKFRKLQKKSS